LAANEGEADEHADQKPTYMRPPGYLREFAVPWSLGVQPGHQLERKPQQQVKPGWYRDKPQRERNQKKRQHACGWEEDQIRTRYRRHCSTGTNHRRGREWRTVCLDEDGCHPTNTIKNEVTDMAVTIFYAASKDMEIQQVAKKMQPTAMQEHAAQER
jgi:hypothetical protein